MKIPVFKMSKQYKKYFEENDLRSQKMKIKKDDKKRAG